MHILGAKQIAQACITVQLYNALQNFTIYLSTPHPLQEKNSLWLVLYNTVTQVGAEVSTAVYC